MSTLLEILANASIRSVRSKGRGITIRFGTDDVRDMSDGTFPVDVARCNRMPDGKIETKTSRVTKPSNLKTAVRRAGDGSRSGAVEQWVEIRTPIHTWTEHRTVGDQDVTACQACGVVRNEINAERRCGGPVAVTPRS